MYLTPPSSDGRRTIALPLDRVITVGGGIEWQWKGVEIHSAPNYVHIGDANLDQDNGLAPLCHVLVMAIYQSHCSGLFFA